MTKPDLRGEIEQAFEDSTGVLKFASDFEIALWAARWMAERCAELTDKTNPVEWDVPSMIRQLAKELE